MKQLSLDIPPVAYIPEPKEICIDWNPPWAPEGFHVSFMEWMNPPDHNGRLRGWDYYKCHAYSVHFLED